MDRPGNCWRYSHSGCGRIFERRIAIYASPGDRLNMQFHTLLLPNCDGNCERAHNLLFLLEFIVADRRPGPAANATNIDRSITTQAAGDSGAGHCLPAASRTAKRKRPCGAVFFRCPPLKLRSPAWRDRRPESRSGFRRPPSSAAGTPCGRRSGPCRRRAC